MSSNTANLEEAARLPSAFPSTPTSEIPPSNPDPAQLEEAELVPGAFPDEEAIVENEQATHISHDPTLTGTTSTGDVRQAEKAKEFAQQQHAAHTAGQTSNTATSGSGGQDEKATQFHEQQHAAHTATSEQESSRTGVSSHPGQNSEAWTDVTNPDDLLHNADSKQSPTAHASRDQTSGADQPTSTAPESGVDLSSIGSSLATAATAAKDALFGAKEAVAPVANATVEQAQNLAGYAQENAVPAAKYVAAKTQDAVASTRDTVDSGINSRDTVPTGGVLDAANSAASYAKDTVVSAANTAQSYAPNVLGEPTSSGLSAQDIASGVPTTVKDSVSQAGESPEAAANAEAVKEKSQMEKELLSQTHTSHSHGQENTKPEDKLFGRVKGLTLEEQLMPDSLTPGVAKVLGTEHDRSFPLGVSDESPKKIDG